MPDMIINLYEQDYVQIKQLNENIEIKRVLAPDRRKIIDFVRHNFDETLLMNVSLR